MQTLRSLLLISLLALACGCGESAQEHTFDLQFDQTKKDISELGKVIEYEDYVTAYDKARADLVILLSDAVLSSVKSNYQIIKYNELVDYFHQQNQIAALIRQAYCKGMYNQWQLDSRKMLSKETKPRVKKSVPKNYYQFYIPDNSSRWLRASY